MSASETIVSILKGKLLLDPLGFTENADAASSEVNDIALKFKQAGKITADVVKDVSTAAMGAGTAFTGVMKTIDAPKGDVPGFGTGMASMGLEAASSGTAPVLRGTGLQGTSEQASGAFPVLRVIR